MSLEDFLVPLVGINGLLLVVLVLRVPGVVRIQLIPLGGTLGLLGVLWFLAPGWAGRVSALSALVSYVVPLISAVVARRRAFVGRHDEARAWLLLAVPILGPRAVREQRGLISALATFDADEARGLEVLETLARDPSPHVRYPAVVLQLLHTQRYSELIDRVDSDPGLSDFLLNHPGWMPKVLSAHAGLNDFPGMLSRFAAHEQTPIYQRNPMDRAMVDLSVLAHSGHPESVERLLAGPLVDWSAPVQDGWRAVARARAGRAIEAQALNQHLLDTAKGALRRQAERRVHSPPGPAELDGIPESLRGKLKTLAEAALTHPPAPSRLFYPVTGLTLVVLLVIHLAVAFSEGGFRPDSLYRWGALAGGPPEVFSKYGAIYRYFSANLLHAGWVHLVANLLALFVFGRYLEAEVGSLRVLVILVLSGPLSMLTVDLASRSEHARPFLVVGASGALMGLVGASLFLYLINPSFRRHRRWQIKALMLVLGLQLLFDLSNPVVSAGAHLSGAFWGAVLALPMGLMLRPRSFPKGGAA